MTSILHGLRPPATSDGEIARPARNSRVTAMTGSVLLVLLLAQIVTWLLGVRQHISWHVFLGVSASALVVVKASSTGYRFSRYYRRDADYVAAGPPAPLMRVLSPLFLLVSVLLLGTGLLLISLGPAHAGVFRGLHGLLFCRGWPCSQSTSWSTCPGCRGCYSTARRVRDEPTMVGTWW